MLLFGSRMLLFGLRVSRIVFGVPSSDVLPVLWNSRAETSRLEIAWGSSCGGDAFLWNGCASLYSGGVIQRSACAIVSNGRCVSWGSSRILLSAILTLREVCHVWLSVRSVPLNELQIVVEALRMCTGIYYIYCVCCANLCRCDERNPVLVEHAWSLLLWRDEMRAHLCDVGVENLRLRAEKINWKVEKSKYKIMDLWKKESKV